MDYLNQHSTLTLSQGLEEYTNHYPFLNNNEGKDEASQWFRKHDITHVLFGTIPFQIRGEAINDTWTLFGTDVTLRGYKEFFKYVDYNTVINSYLKQYKFKFIVYSVMAKYLPICFIAYVRAKKMHKKWDWHNHDHYLDMKLCNIRKEFNIKVIKP
ncbi:hypothetical protein OAO18_03625 [Francisellaceae bacterium]|nr:hypothetical protein [Francisellaceae bacterium]